jgi:sugar lactone lactonase YvrE
MSRLRCLAVACVLLGLVAPVADARARFDTRLFAIMPPPGYPALAYVAPNHRIYEGTYETPTGSTMPSRVLEYSSGGYLQRSWTVRGEDLSQGHGVQVATSDARGDLILLEKNPARALVLNTRTGRQSTYASFPDLRTCPPVVYAGTPCSPAAQDLAPMPDYAAWGPDGSLYVTDYQQAVIWRVPPHGGASRVWLADPRLDGNMFGTAGIELAADRRTLLFTQASSAGLGVLPGPIGGGPPVSNPTTGKLYAVTIAPGGGPGPIRQLWESRTADAPDGLAIARSGDIYIALPGPGNQLVEVNPAGHEIARFPATPGTGADGSPVPFDAPSSAMFLGTRLIVANQAYISGTSAHMAILDVEAGESGLTPLIPAGAGPGPGASRDASRSRRR